MGEPEYPHLEVERLLHAVECLPQHHCVLREHTVMCGVRRLDGQRY